MATYSVDKIRENILRIREEIAAAARQAGRAPEDIRLCAASKTQSAETLRAVADMPIDLFGENRVQELTEKLRLQAYGDKPVDFIGHLQTNKVKQVVGSVGMIHSVDSVKLAQAIDKEAAKRGLVQDILVEINIGREENKSGVLLEEVSAFFDALEGLSAIKVRGLMSVPPKCAYPEQNTQYFETLYKLFIDIKGKKYDNVNMEYLSMGMSGDYRQAVLAGANIVRLGSAIFGPRDYPNIENENAATKGA